jgi:two-component sensor histidine kinase
MEQLQTALEPLPEAPAHARALMSQLVDSLPATSYRDLQVVLTELVTNAVKYGPDEEIRVTLEVSGPIVRGEVADGGIGGAAIDRERCMDGDRLGLQIVDALCTTWDNPAGTGRVRFELNQPEAEPLVPHRPPGPGHVRHH